MPYTTLNNQSVQQILQQFDIAPLVKWEILKGGSANTNHLIETTEQKYVLTICDSKTFEATKILVDLLKHLANHHFKTSKVIANKAGESIHFFNNKPIILKEYIVGKVIRNHTDDTLEQIGQTIAKLHLIPSPDYLSKPASCGTEILSQLKNEISHPFVDWLDEMHVYVKNNIDHDLPKTLVHRDIFFSNVIIDNEDQPIIFDFEEACYYYRMYDIGMAIIGLCNEQGTINFSKVDKLIHGYEQITILEVREKEMMPFFIGYAATFIASWRFCQFRLITPTLSSQNTYLEMKKIASEMRFIS